MVFNRAINHFSRRFLHFHHTINANRIRASEKNIFVNIFIVHYKLNYLMNYKMNYTNVE